MFFEKLINTAYCFGAAIVVFGAWGKIEHKDFGSTALTIGLLTETAIFCIYGFMEWRLRPNEPDPQQDTGPHSAGAEREVTRIGKTNGVVEVDELTATMKRTNQILNQVFKAD